MVWTGKRRSRSSTYPASREGKPASAFVRGWQGLLMVDDDTGCKALFHDGTSTEHGGIAHARRKYLDRTNAQCSPIAARVLRHIGRRYRIETKPQN
jgi:hypothetical protein